MSAFTISRSVTIAASPDKVRAHVEDFRAWQAWSPWEELDPHLDRRYSGAERGVGAAYAWQGNRRAGAGSMEVIAATPQSLTIELRFLKPWRATNQVVFTFAPEGTGTHLTWTMSGTHTGLAKLFNRFLDLEKLVGPDLEKGLAKLKAVSESPATT